MTEEGVREDAATAALRTQLAEAQETLRAIRDGEVDALLMSNGAPGYQVFTLSSADRPYRLFVETMADGAATVSESGVVLYANQRLAEMLGRPVTHIVGAPLTSLVAERHHAALVRYAGSSDTDGTLEIELLRAARQRLWVRVGASLLDVDGEPMHCLTFADLTQTRRHQSALASAHQKALQALQTRSQFVANMSHEIRTPLNGVIGMTELMLTTTLTEEQREYADGVRASADALMSVVDQILDFSKLDSGSLEIEDIPYDPLAVLEEACATVSAGAHSKNVELLSEVVGSMPTLVTGDRTRLRQVLINLMGNAVKFTAEGYVCTTLSAVSEGSGWRLRFAVQDTGVGIEAAATGRIFNSFSQADGSTTREYGGTGLGLAISRQLVGLMGGEIGVESAKGLGSTFWFTVLTGAVREIAGQAATPALGPARVLLVDDSAASLRVLEDQLIGWRLSCVAVSGGEEALVAYREAKAAGGGFDLLLLDSAMPGMDGISLARELRALAGPLEAGARPVPVVLMVTDQRVRAAAQEVGVQHFVSKPLRQGRLHAALAEALHPGTVQPADLAAPLPAVPGTSGHGGHPADGGGGPSRLAVGEPVPIAVTGTSPAAILLVEDNRVNQMVAVRMLEKRGFQVDVAADGQLALSMYRRLPYRAILMDCQMPVLDGFLATAEIRRQEAEGEHVPILAMTANTIKGDREKCLAAGMDDYLGKPFTGDALDTALARLLPGGAGHGPGAAPVEPPLSTAPVLDPSVIADLCGDDVELRQDLLSMYAHHLEAALVKVEAAVVAGDRQALLAESHTLKGSSGSVGALRVAEISEALGTAARTGVWDRVPELLDRLRVATTATLEAMAPAAAVVDPLPDPLVA